MAKQKKMKKANPNSPFWHPKNAGDSLAGTFVGFTKTQIGVVMQVKTPKGEIPVGLGSNLRQTIKPVAEKMKIGDKVKFQYKGTVKTKKGRPCKQFDFTLNGKKLVSAAFDVKTGTGVAALFE